MDGIFNWIEKCVIYFIPVLLMWARYHSFLLQYKKAAVDVIVDGQFCVIPFCLNLETIFHLWSKWRSSEEIMRHQGVILFVCLLVIAFAFLLLYWDISFIRIQKEDETQDEREDGKNLAMTKKKKSMMHKIILFLVAALGVSFYVDVIL